jgi:hypothetical protein
VRRFISILLGAFACLAVGAGTASATTNPVLYSSLPAPGTVSIPSVGVEAYSFNQIGNEVILTRSATAHHVSVTMVDWACQTGAWNTGDCATAPGATYPTTITLHLYRASTRNSTTGEVTPGTQITHITKTFNIKFRPTSDPSCGLDGNGLADALFRGSDGQCHHGLDQTVVFPLSRNLPTDVVWGVSYNSDNSGPTPIGGSGAPQDSLNVGLAPKTTVGHARYDDAIFWDTRVQGFSCAAPAPDGNSGPFQTGVFNLDGPCDGANNSWAGFVPAAKFSTN